MYAKNIGEKNPKVTAENTSLIFSTFLNPTISLYTSNPAKNVPITKCNPTNSEISDNPSAEMSNTPNPASLVFSFANTGVSFCGNQCCVFFNTKISKKTPPRKAAILKIENPISPNSSSPPFCAN